jgi:hypothetical protein
MSGREPEAKTTPRNSDPGPRLNQGSVALLAGRSALRPVLAREPGQPANGRGLTQASHALCFGEIAKSPRSRRTRSVGRCARLIPFNRQRLCWRSCMFCRIHGALQITHNPS